ncbi:MAG: undecaprenyl-phosphate glucose phosphotransferase [Myxococcales bacterium]|nr:undecaprenyl-phosphate glucose phosphotransferase [Myxococcales bacterium]MCB9630377.1 undecaprenyl-phosphate glucose phosphotransferase [Sandaracinaceae bacterium]
MPLFDSTKTGIIRPYHSLLTLVQRALDVAMIVLALWFTRSVYAGPDVEPWRIHDTLEAGAASLLFLFSADACGLYLGFRGVPLIQELKRVWLAWFAVFALLLLLAFALKESATYSRAVSLGWMLAAPVFVSVWRSLVRLSLHEARRRGHSTRRVAIVGMTSLGERVARSLRAAPSLGLVLEGFYDDRGEDRREEIDSELGEFAGNFEELVARATLGDLDLVYVCLPLRAESRVHKLIAQLADTTVSVYVVPDFFVFDLLHARWTALGDIPVVSIFETPFMGTEGWLKRAEDLVLGTLAVAVAAIPMALIAIGIKLTSKGPVLFKQRRYGLHGEVIDVYKFRSMTVAEDGANVRQATANDSRITPFGAFLRRTSLDELPQLVHVVTGSMSLVGPRPHAVAHNEAYRKHIYGYMLRHKVKPGLTGWAQVNGWRGETDTLEKMEKRIEHDLEYIRRWNLLLDIKIVFLTVFGRAVHQNAK